jgi:hypothetical protein
MLILLNESSRSNTSHDRFTQVDAESILSALASNTITRVTLLKADPALADAPALEMSPTYKFSTT